MHFALEALGEIGQVMQKELVIRLGIETRLAVVATLDDVRALCDVPPEAEALLTSPQAPIRHFRFRKKSSQGRGRSVPLALGSQDIKER